MGNVRIYDQETGDVLEVGEDVAAMLCQADKYATTPPQDILDEANAPTAQDGVATTPPSQPAAELSNSPGANLVAGAPANDATTAPPAATAEQRVTET